MASIATRDERPVLGFATMGGNGQAMFHLQVLTNLSTTDWTSRRRSSARAS